MWKIQLVFCIASVNCYYSGPKSGINFDAVMQIVQVNGSNASAYTYYL